MPEINLVIQYLHWALISAHKIAHPECSKVTVVLDLDRKQATTSSEKRYKGHPSNCKCQACQKSPFEE